MRTTTIALLALSGCYGPPTQAELDGTRGSRVDFYFNDPGARRETIWESDAVDIMIDLVDNASASIDFAVMGFTYAPLYEAFVRAYDRGVAVRMVGDAGHLYNSGYHAMYDRHIPIVTGNLAHIMHDKFMIVDNRFVFAGTSNWSVTDLEHNSNNFFFIDSPDVAADFYDEFQQMWDGLYGHQKVQIDNGRSYQVGDTRVEVWFAPNEDAMGRILELVDAAERSVWFTIFAFTKDQVGSALVRKHEELTRQGIVTPGDPTTGIAGVIDQSQLHSNGQYHEVYRLLGAGIPLHMDGNDASRQPGDYQAGGGRLHSKTMVIDADGANPVVISGSFNWSSSATASNDEFLCVFHGPRAAELYRDYFFLLWDNGRRMGGDRVQPGDVVINEIMWYGVHDNDVDGFDEFIELRNTTNEDIDLSLWQIANPDDFVVGLPPGSVIPANGLFTIVDHVLEPYVDGAPQDEHTSFLRGDLVVNAFNDNRQSRLYLKDTALELMVKDPDGLVIDRAGDGGPAFAGGPEGPAARSMQRISDADGALRSSWAASTVSEGGINVNPGLVVLGDPSDLRTYREIVLATPGE